ncbi:sugar phosphate isomerase/epimerase family protein [Clostridium brassicae]|uniref:TIM barrel protein n=1 Tax=Clostridium brassicae TaxID=2999072 RepID=A0ABT4D7X3_9CLOT|nr:TIM barrel protein [Clostridium brassicae]MCY6958402.1 TIM barrel protein [Clostridium brassicae]
MNCKLAAMNCHYRFYPLEYFFSSAKENGFKAVEIWTGPQHFYMDYKNYEDVNKLKELSWKYQIEVISICPEQTNPKPNNIAIKDNKRKENVKRYFCNAIDVASEVGCKHIVITSGWAFYNENLEEAFNRSVHMIKDIAIYAEKKKIYLAIEALQPMESKLVTNISDIKKLKKMVNSDYLKICIDFGAMAKAGESIKEYFQAFGNDIIHVHFVDGTPTGHLAWGDGERNLEQDIRDLEKWGYKGYLSLETANERYYENPSEADKKSIIAFNKIIKEKKI